MAQFARVYYEQRTKAEKAAVLCRSMRVRSDLRHLRRACQGWDEVATRVRPLPFSERIRRRALV